MFIGWWHLQDILTRNNLLDRRVLHHGIKSIERQYLLVPVIWKDQNNWNLLFLFHPLLEAIL